MADTDAQGVSTFAVLGARTGYRLLWGFVVSMILLYATQEMGARLGLVTGKGLADLLRERFGVRVVTLAMLAMIVANFATVVADFAGVAASLDLFHPGAKFVGVPLIALVVYEIVVRGSYRRVERIFLVLGLFFAAYVLSAVLARPDWGAAARGTLVPGLHFGSATMIAFVAAIGTTVTVWGQFFIQSSVVDKGLLRAELAYTRVDLAAAALLAAGFGWFIAVTAAATLHPHHIEIANAADAARSLAPLTGTPALAEAVFAGGLLMAGVLGVAVISLATAYTACEGFGWESGLDRSPEAAPQFYLLFRALLAGAALLVLAPRLPLIRVMFGSNLLSALALPFILWLLLRLANDRELLGSDVNGRTANAIGGFAIAALVVLNAALIVMSILGIG
jgi:Mn2+/Fe2+ NRAMP family transporter